MTCKDCVHCRACHEMYLIAVSQEDDFFEINDADTCEDFKHKYSFAEVVRCKECKMARKIDNLGNFRCFVFQNTVKGIHFCSYGEKEPQ